MRTEKEQSEAKRRNIEKSLELLNRAKWFITRASVSVPYDEDYDDLDCIAEQINKLEREIRTRFDD